MIDYMYIICIYLTADWHKEDKKKVKKQFTKKEKKMLLWLFKEKL